MPTISRFLGISIKMYYMQKEHNPPHIHAISGDMVGMFSIENGEMFEGDRMTHRIVHVEAKDNFIIVVDFIDGSRKKFDIKELFTQYPQFSRLGNVPEQFADVVVDTGGYGISWNDELDLDAETIWENGVLVEIQQPKSLNNTQEPTNPAFMRVCRLSLCLVTIK